MRVYVSSTSLDLAEYRQAVIRALWLSGHTPVCMEHHAPGDVVPKDESLRKVATCDVYVGIFAWRYGFIPQGCEFSITEMEYREAERLKKTTLIFLLDEGVEWPAEYREGGENERRIRELRERLQQDKWVHFFTNPDSLTAEVLTAIAQVSASSSKKAAILDKREGLLSKEEQVELALRAKNCDQEAWGKLYELHRKSILAFLRRKLYDKSIAEDLCEDTFLLAYKNLREGKYDSAYGFPAYLKNTAALILLRYFKGKKKVDSELVIACEEPNPENRWMAETEEKLLKLRLQEVIDKLPEDMRQAVYLIRCDGLSYKEASEILGLPVNTVKSRVSRGIRELRKLFEEYKDGLHGELPLERETSRPKTVENIDNLRFSAFYPEKVGPRDIGKIIAYGHMESVAGEVAQDATKRLQLPSDIKIKAGSEKPSRPVPKESIIKVTPDVPGLVFDKAEDTMSLWEDLQSVEFRFKPHSDYIGKVCRGWVHFWLEGLILCDVPVTIFVAEEKVPDIFREALAKANARPYRHVFPSYSHVDSEVVEIMATYAKSFGDEYFQDVRKLRAGQCWNEELLDFIKKADVFQLFWSENAAISEYVEQEWRHALKERKVRPDPYFLRPVYWTEKPALPIPAELQEIHFAQIPYSALKGG